MDVALNCDSLNRDSSCQEKGDWTLDLSPAGTVATSGAAAFVTRRAGPEDLPALRRLLEGCGVSENEEMTEILGELERRLAEFIVVEKDGTVAGCVGLEMFQQQGHLYGEAYVHPRLAELLRPVLWERVLRVATNHGLARLWTRLRDPFFEQQGLAWAGEEARREVPRRFGRSDQAWRMVQWREELPEAVQTFFDVELEQELRLQRSYRRAISQQRAGEIVRHVLPLVFVILVILVFKVLGE